MGWCFTFFPGEQVRIVDGFEYRGELATIEDAQIMYSGRTAYALEEFPGWWPESSLERIAQLKGADRDEFSGNREVSTDRSGSQPMAEMVSVGGADRARGVDRDGQDTCPPKERATGSTDPHVFDAHAPHISADRPQVTKPAASCVICDSAAQVLVNEEPLCLPHFMVGLADLVCEPLKITTERWDTSTEEEQEAKFEKAKRWFSDGEFDVDLMISMGAITKAQILWMYERKTAE